MAKSSLEKIAEALNNVKSSNQDNEIKMPAGKKDKTEENQLTEIDLIAGICSSALFGESNADVKKANQLANNPKKSLLFNVSDLLSQFLPVYGKYIAHMLTRDKQFFEKIVNSSNTVRITVDNINSTVLDNISQLLYNNLSKEDNTDNKVSNQKAIIDISINGVTDLNKLSIQLKDLTSIVNNPDLLQGLRDTFAGIGDITTNSQQFINNITGMDKFIESLSESIPSIKDNIKKLNELFVNPEEFIINIPNLVPSNDQIEQLDNYSVYLNKITDVFKNLIDKLDKTFDGINKDFNNLNNKIDSETIKKLQDSIKAINDKFKQKLDLSNLTNFINQINNLFKDKENIKNVKGIGELIDSIIHIAQFNSKDLDISGIYQLSSFVNENGPIAAIIKNIKKLGDIVIDSKASNAVIFTTRYLDAISKIADISLLDQIRIMMNIKFFNWFVNKQLPGLISDINNNFRGIRLGNKTDTLYNLQSYFYTLKNIASLSLKDQAKLFSSIKVLRSIVINELGKLVKDISDKFNKIEINDNIKKIFDLFATFKNLTGFESLKEQRKGLKELYRFLFGSALLGEAKKLLGKNKKAGKMLNYLPGDYSVLSIIEQLNSEKETLESAANVFDKLQKVFIIINNVINNKLDPKSIKTMAKSIDILQEDIIDVIIEIGQKNKIEYINQGFAVINALITSIKTTFQNRSTLDTAIKKMVIGKDTYKNFKDTIKLLNELPKLIKAINLCAKLDMISEKALNKLIKVSDQIKTLINKFSGFDEKKLKTAQKVMKSIMMIMVMNTTLLLLGAAVMAIIPIEGIIGFIIGISVMTLCVAGLLKLLTSKSFSDKNVKEAIQAAYNMSLVILLLGTTLTICSLLMKSIEWTAVGLFLVGLTFMLVGMVGILLLLGKFKRTIFKSAIPAVRDLAILVIACGLSLALAALVGKFVSLKELIWFGVLIMGLILSVMVPLIFFKSVSIFMFSGIHELGILVLSCAAALALAGLVTKWIDMGSLSLFTVMLTFLVSGIVLSLGLFGKKEIQGAKELGQLVMYCSAAMLIGGLLFMLLGEPFKKGVQDFALTLGLFVAGIALVVGIAARIGQEGIKDMKAINNIVIISAATLLIGGLLFMWGGSKFKKAVQDFALTLFLFIGGISLCVALVGAIVKEDNMKKMWQLSLLVFVSALAITLGPILLKEFNISMDEVQNFVGMALALVGGVSAIVLLLGLIPKKILKRGILAMAAIEALIYGLGIVMFKITETIKVVNELGWGPFLNGLAKMAVVIGGITAVIAALGALMVSPAWLLMSAGAAALATIEGLIWGLSKCIISLVSAVKALETIKNLDMGEVLDPFFSFLYKSKDLLTIFGWDELAKIKGLTVALSSMGSMISSIALGVQQYANLKIAEEWDPVTGKPTKFRHLTKTDFTEAAHNIGTIISVLGKAILEIYQGKINGKQVMPVNDAKEMFSSSWMSGSRFDKVVKSVSKLGGMISNIAYGIQQFANLKIPTRWNDNGKPIAFEKMTPEYFTNAAEAIAKVITTLGMSVMAVYTGKQWNPNTGKFTSIPNFTEEDAKNMFTGGTWFTNSPFDRVVKSTSKIGGLISSLAKGIQDYATLAIPTAWDKDGKPIAWKKMEDTEFTAAGENIGKVIMSLGKAVVDTAKDPAFDSIYDLAAMQAIINSIGKVSNFIGPLSNVLVKYATGKFYRLEYKDGKLNTVQGPEGLVDIEKEFGSWKGLQQKLNESIKSILIGLGSAISAAMVDPRLKEFTEKSDTLTIFISNMIAIGDMMKSVFDSIKEITNLKVWTKEVILHIVNPFNQFIKVFDMSDGSNLQYIFKNDNDATKFADNFASYADTVSKLFKTIKEISEAKIQLTTENGKTIFEIMVDSCANSLMTMKTINYPKEVSDMIDMYADDIVKLVKSIKEADEEFLKKSNILVNGVLGVYVATSAIKANKAFADHAETMSKYVESVNAIDVSKVESLTNLTYAVTNLGDNIKNIDKFTDTLANKVSNTLDALTKEINTAAGIIKKADELHKKRQNTIKESVGKITELMNKSMVVEIKNDQPTQTGGADAGTPGNETTDTTTTNGNISVDTNNNTNNGNSSGKQRQSKSTVDINTRALANAIVQALLDAGVLHN